MTGNSSTMKLQTIYNEIKNVIDIIIIFSIFVFLDIRSMF